MHYAVLLLVSLSVKLLVGALLWLEFAEIILFWEGGGSLTTLHEIVTKRKQIDLKF